MSVVIETTIGDLTVDLFLKERPRACQNFLKLCKLKYYNFSLFHTVQRDFIAQTGDPSGTGKGGCSLYGMLYGDQAKYFEAERSPKMKHRNFGTLSFASHGDNLLGSQFFLTLAEDLESLDSEHCVFGQVVEGMDVLAKLNDAICDQNFQPYQDIRITHTVILDDPLDDPEGLEVPRRSPSPSSDVLKSGRIAADEDVEDTAGRTAAELDELIQQREAAARATILEMVGDLPDADAAPPENVLFVCKLNPVTTDDDLQIIFSRFGKIVSCEIIRDQKTKNSLQYGFIEFDNPRSCENAYFKMDNVLIDDRRIHVDFSQSVARVQWKGKGRITYQKGTDAKDLGNYRSRGRDVAGQGRGGGPPGRGRDGRQTRDGEERDGGRRRDQTGYHRHSGTDRRREEGRRREVPSDRHEKRPQDQGRYRERSKDANQRLTGGLDVDQLKALLKKRDRKRRDSDSANEVDASKKKKSSRHDSSSDSDSSVDEAPARKNKKSRRGHAYTPEPKHSKEKKQSKKKHSHKDSDHKSERHAKKKKQRRRSRSESSSERSSSEERHRKRKKTKR